MRYFLFLYFIFLLNSCKTTGAVRILTLKEGISINYKAIEFTNLVKALKDYDGQYIETSGIYYSGPEQSGLYSLVDTNFTKPVLWIEFDDRLSFKIFFTKKESINPFLKRLPVKIRGKVDYLNRGHMGSYSGSIVEITYVEKL